MISEGLRQNPEFRATWEKAWRVLEAEGKKLDRPLPPTSEEGSARIQTELARYSADRGRDLYFPYLGSGFGWGPFIELLDGSVKYDMITGIGVHFLGHAHPALVKSQWNTSFSDIMESNLMPGEELTRVFRELIEIAGPKSKLKHVWSTCSGTMANEVALRILRAKKHPASRVFAFEDCFAGRSAAMLEITDSPKYREGQPVYGEVHHLPFYTSSISLSENISRTTRAIESEMARWQGKYCALVTELVQGEGGFKTAPREWFEAVFKRCKELGLLIWADEIQTFARTGEPFAFQTLGLEEWMDVVTVGKALQLCAVLYTQELNPKGLIMGGTFASSTSAAHAALVVLKELREGGLTGKNGKILRLSKYFQSGLEKLAAGSCKGKISEIRALGGMIAFQPFSGKQDEVKKFLLDLFHRGVIAFNNGHDPYLVRLLPPLPCMEEKHIDTVLTIIESATLGKPS